MERQTLEKLEIPTFNLQPSELMALLCVIRHERILNLLILAYRLGFGLGNPDFLDLGWCAKIKNLGLTAKIQEPRNQEESSWFFFVFSIL